jgi:CheY-like chemotaxis protein
VELPLLAVSPERAPAGLPCVAAPRRLGGVRVLVVDDEPDAREMVKRVLEECDADVVTAGSAGEALDMMRSQPADVLISDIGMPEQDGYDLIRKLRRLDPHQGGRTPAAALTALARPEDRVRALRAGYQLHLAKPVNPAELISVVAVLADREAA